MRESAPAARAARRHARTRRRQRRRVLGARDRHRALPLRRRGQTEQRAHRAARAHRRRLPRLRRRHRRRARATACARTGPGTRATATASTPPSCSSTPTRRRSTGRFALHPALFGELPDGDAQRRRQRAFVPKAHRRSAVRAAAGAGRARALAGHGRSTSCTCAATRRTLAAVPEALRGTCAGLAHPAAIEHLARLGVTTVELMPVAAWHRRAPPAAARAHQLLGLQPGRAAGARPAARAGRHRRARRLRRRAARGRASRSCSTSSSTTPARATRRARRCRCAASTTRPTTALRPGDGAATSTTPAAATRWRSTARRCCAWRSTRCATSRPRGVDGFRFDLATTLGRRDDGFDPAAPLLQAIAQDPVLRELQADRRALGHRPRRLPARRAFPPAGASGTTATATPCAASGAATTGSPASSPRGSPAPPTSSPRARARRRARSTSSPRTTASRWPTSSPTQRKHNEANGEDNRDGTDANLSWNHGVEGATDDAAVRAARAPRRAGLLATLLRLARHADAGDGRRAGPHAARQQQRLRAGQRARLGRLGRAPTRAGGLHRRADRAAPAPPRAARRPLADRRAGRRERHPRRRVAASRRARDGAADWAGGDNRALVAVLFAAATDGVPADRVAIAFNAGRDAAAVRWPDRARAGLAPAVDTSLPAGTGRRTPPAGRTGDARRAVGDRARRGSGAAARARPTGIEPAVLDRLAAAAGIAPDWVDVPGRDTSSPRTRMLALLAAMGWARRHHRRGARAAGRDRRRPRAPAAAAGVPRARGRPRRSWRWR